MTRNHQAQTRRYRTGRLHLEPDPAAELRCIEIANDLVSVGRELLAEDKDNGGSAFLHSGAPEPSLEKLAARVGKLAAAHFSPTANPEMLRTIRSVATILDAPYNHLLAGLGPRAQLVAPIVAALESYDALLGATVAHVIRSEAGKPNRDTQVYGVDRRDKVGGVERRLVLSNLGGDTMVPIASHAFVTGTRDDRNLAEADRLAEARQAMRAWGFDEPPSSVAEHTAMLLEILNGSRQVIANAKNGSWALSVAGVDAPGLLRAGFSNWLLVDRLEYGPRRSQKHLTTGTLYEPGLDGPLLRTIDRYRYRTVCHAGDDHMPPAAQQAGGAMYTVKGRSMRGADAIAALLAFDSAKLVGLHTLGETELEMVSSATEIGLPHDMIAAVLPKGFVLLEGELTPVGAIVISAYGQTAIFTTNTRLEVPSEMVKAVAMAAALMRSSLDPTWMNCTKRFHADAGIFIEKASTYHSRNGLRLLKMLANLIAVGVARNPLPGG